MAERIASEDDRARSVITRVVFRRLRRIGHVPTPYSIQISTPLNETGAVIGCVMLHGRSLMNLIFSAQIILIIHFRKEIAGAVVEELRAGQPDDAPVGVNGAQVVIGLRAAQ